MWPCGVYQFIAEVIGVMLLTIALIWVAEYLRRRAERQPRDTGHGTRPR